ncbi:deoxyribodipyrimidine photo-lyase [Neocloeon triangulifer]|uniref:deoxyribodipyrimidine photo-lyase n=1 Tax=Neocloeon triangulifer TaxID=2078957 RepID=UPI00286ED766|nr:deoxyribodipyrimidine photo-lyase [Neocloeon triangulifer]
MASGTKKLKLDSSSKSISVGDFVHQIKEERKKAGKSVVDFKYNKKRVKILSKVTEVPEECSGIVYWMSRDQRVQDNWAMLFAQKLAIKNKLPLHVCFCLLPKFLDATIRHFNFMLEGLQEVQQDCSKLDIQFHLLEGEAATVLPAFITSHDIGGLVIDFSPLRTHRQWVEDLKEKLPSQVPLCQVDAHNIVPCWVASDKLEYGARTIRKKITDKLPEFLTEYPPVINHEYPAQTKAEPIDWEALEKKLQVDRTVGPVSWAKPGASAGLAMLNEFCSKRLKLFGSKRNDPTVNALSNLSPWFHFGHLSVQRAIRVVQKFKASHSESVAAFVEEAVVRRELSDNFCYYNPKYDSIEGTNNWAKETLNVHRKDKREYLYTQEELDTSKTHDDLWNSAQLQLVKEGKMHGFLRMYWAKKILEWTESPEEALKIAIHLNDRYNLDGRDPNGYVGCMWSICGIHDQGWGERAIFGKIRFMNYQGCKRKFDVNAFVARYGGKAHPYKKKK